MNKRTFLTTVILTNLSFVLIILHKRNTVTEQLYIKQRYEQDLTHLVKLEHTLRHELSNLQDRATVKAYAQTYLHMAPVTLAQMKKMRSC